jgi:hypothetical protein
MKQSGIRSVALLVTAATLAGCGGPAWPTEEFPSKLASERTLFAEGSNGLREGCVAMVGELTDASAIQVNYAPGVVLDGPFVASPVNGWQPTPINERADTPIYYKGAFGGCDNEGHRPLGDLEGALSRPGAFYRIVNGGEGIAIIVPRAKLVGYVYFG